MSEIDAHYCGTCDHPWGYHNFERGCTMPLDRHGLPVMRTDDQVSVCGCRIIPPDERETECEAEGCDHDGTVESERYGMTLCLGHATYGPSPLENPLCAAEDAMGRRRTEAEARVCSQPDCPGDGRYQPPGRGHLGGCQHDAVQWVWEEVR